MGVSVAEYPTATVHVQNHGQGTGRVRRPDAAHPHASDLGEDSDPPALDVELVDRCGLDVAQHLAGPGGGELMEKGRSRGRVDELLRSSGTQSFD